MHPGPGIVPVMMFTEAPSLQLRKYIFAMQLAVPAEMRFLPEPRAERSTPLMVRSTPLVELDEVEKSVVGTVPATPLGVSSQTILAPRPSSADCPAAPG